MNAENWIIWPWSKIRRLQRALEQSRQLEKQTFWEKRDFESKCFALTAACEELEKANRELHVLNRSNAKKTRTTEVAALRQNVAVQHAREMLNGEQRAHFDQLERDTVMVEMMLFIETLRDRGAIPGDMFGKANLLCAQAGNVTKQAKDELTMRFKAAPISVTSLPVPCNPVLYP